MSNKNYSTGKSYFQELEPSDDIVKYSPDNRNTLVKIFKGIFIIGFLFVLCHLCIVYGALKERWDKNCIKGSELLLWQDTLNTAHSICVDIQTNQLEEIKGNYQARIKSAEEEAEKWKSYYNYQKKELNNLKDNNSNEEEN